MNIVIGIIVIISSILNCYFASNFKKINYIFGLVFYVLCGYVAFKNHIYGMFIFYLFIFAPMQIWGFINWGKKQDENKNVIARTFSIENRIILIVSCIIFSIILANILKQIPYAQFTFLDAFSNIINLSGVILMALRFNESWWLWLINNVIDLILWSNVVKLGGNYSISVLISAIIYLIINIYGIIKWDNKIKNNFINIIKISTKKEIEIISYIANIISVFCYVIINSRVAIFVTSFDILQTVLNRVVKKYNCILSYIYFFIIFVTIILLKPKNIEWLIITDVVLYALIPLVKKDKYIRIIGFINILVFTIFDFYIGLYNLFYMDLFIIAIFIYGIYINDFAKKDSILN